VKKITAVRLQIIDGIASLHNIHALFKEHLNYITEQNTSLSKSICIKCLLLIPVSRIIKKFTNAQLSKNLTTKEAHYHVRDSLSSGP
jgi:hypothetical protein